MVTDTKSNNFSSTQQSLSSLVKSFTARAHQFMKDTEQHALQGVNPGEHEIGRAHV